MVPKDFYQKWLGIKDDFDGAYGVQCVDGFKRFCFEAGIPVKATPNNWANGYWLYRDALGFSQYFDYITNPSEFEDGDWAIWPRVEGGSHPASHIAMVYQGKEFGENQDGKNGGYSLKSTVFSDALGALRWKGWGEFLPYGYTKLIRKGITAYVFRANKAAGYSLHVLSADGPTELKDITEFDTDKVLKVAVVNGGYFQMDTKAEDPYGTHYGVEQDAEAGNTYTQAPKQQGILAFYETKDGHCDFCTADQYYGKSEDVNFAITPYAVRIHNGEKVFGRSVNYGDKDDIPNTQTAAVKFGNGDWAVAVFPDKICPRDTVTFFDCFSDVQELILMDSGESSQMVAWNGERMEKKLYTERKIPNVLTIAKIINAPSIPDNADLEPVPEPVIIPDPEEPEEEETEPMNEETKPTEENAPVEVEGWTDPEPQTNIIVERIAALMSVKSILTLALTAVFGYLVINKAEIPEFFADIYKIVVLFFFGYQTGKTEKNGK